MLGSLFQNVPLTGEKEVPGRQPSPAEATIETRSRREGEVEPGLRLAQPPLSGRRFVLGAQLDAALGGPLESQVQALEHLNDRSELRRADRFADRDR